jgi:hypothetical protein
VVRALDSPGRSAIFRGVCRELVEQQRKAGNRGPEISMSHPVTESLEASVVSFDQHPPQAVSIFPPTTERRLLAQTLVLPESTLAPTHTADDRSPVALEVGRPIRFPPGYATSVRISLFR